MFSTKNNVLQLTSLMLKSGITEVVVCPGSRNIPLVHTFVASGMKCYEVTDERSAAFFALGLIEANGGRPVAVCCTSGSAVLNLAPAVSEAYYRPLPLLVITADRPQRWIGQMDGQTMRQPLAFSSCIRKVVTLPEVQTLDSEDSWHCNRLINEAFITLYRSAGPVHINVPISEPMFDFSAPTLPDERLIQYVPSNTTFSLTPDMKESWHNAATTMLIVGQLSPEEAHTLAPSILSIAKSGCIIIAETLSNLHTIPELTPYLASNFEQVLAAEQPFPVPELIITLGGHIVSKRLKQYLRLHKPSAHWHISPLGEVADLFMSSTMLIHTTPTAFAEALATEKKEGKHSYEPLYTNERDIKGDIEIHTILSAIGPEWSLQVANSTMIRTVNRLLHTPNPVFCNRGINGIEGSISTAVGYWAGSHRPTLILTGDLSFFYDQNALWNTFVKHPEAPLRIVLLNNGCGDIFHHLPGLASPALDRYISASHNTTAEGAALQCGAHYTHTTSPETLNTVLPSFLSMENDVRILEIEKVSD